MGEIPAEAVRIAETIGPDLPPDRWVGARGEGIVGRDTVLPVGTIGARGVDAQDGTEKGVRMPGHVVPLEVDGSAVTETEIEFAVIRVLPVRDWGEGDLLRTVPRGRCNEAQDFAVRAGKGRRHGVRQPPLGQHILQRRGLIGRHVGRDVGCVDHRLAMPQLGVRRVENAVVYEVRVQRKTPQPACHAGIAHEVGEYPAYIEEHGRRAALHAIEQAHQLVHEEHPGLAWVGPQERDTLVSRAAGQQRKLRVVLQLHHEAGGLHGRDQARRGRRMRVDGEGLEPLRRGFPVDEGEDRRHVGRRQVGE